MNDIITNVTSGLFAEIGKIIQHMESQASRIADLERQLAEASAPAVEQQPVAWRYQRDTQSRPGVGDGEWCFIGDCKLALELQGKAPIAAPYKANDSYHCWEPLYTAPQAAEADKVREAIKYSAGLRIAIENAASGYGEFIDAGLAETIGKEVVTFLNFSMAAQAPVRDKNAERWAKLMAADNSTILHFYNTRPDLRIAFVDALPAAPVQQEPKP